MSTVDGSGVVGLPGRRDARCAATSIRPAPPASIANPMAGNPSALQPSAGAVAPASARTEIPRGVGFPHDGGPLPVEPLGKPADLSAQGPTTSRGSPRVTE